MNFRLILFTRYPVPGSTKTRLIPALGAEGAADLQREMTEHILSRLRPLGGEGVEIEVRYDGGDESAMAAWLGDGLLLTAQGAGDLGQRMERAFTGAFADGIKKAVIVGGDCPELDAPDVREALALLEDNPIVLGPASDGGYYLIAMTSSASPALYGAVFSDIPWGTREVLWRTVNALADAGMDMGLLDEKADVDEPEDLAVWETARSKRKARSAKREPVTKWFASPFEASPKYPVPSTQESKPQAISVIIPTLNEEERIGELLVALEDEGVEVVVADGGSTDNTVSICEEAGVRVEVSPRGRAEQMNAGAEAASGDILLFLHADTRLPEGFAFNVRKAVAYGAAGGAFLFGTDSDTASMRLIENAVHFRTVRLGIVFGDQAIFIRSETFRKIGGFPDLPVMEDYELWKRLGKAGRRELIPLQVTTSSRKWTDRGVWRTTLINQAVMWLYVLGVDPGWLGRWYGKTGRREKGKGKRDL
ncbi:MAG: TIGR04283 family arsenosugar biosynthesis glycosyltransferase [bacterium]|nr:TIGR04283 family arsenosugar biosynthesis glycosyltransferase [bacterium]